MQQVNFLGDDNFMTIQNANTTPRYAKQKKGIQKGDPNGLKWT